METLRRWRTRLLIVVAAAVMMGGGSVVAHGSPPSPQPPQLPKGPRAAAAVPQPAAPTRDVHSLAAPCRLFDSRVSGLPIPAGGTRIVPISGKCDLPSGDPFTPTILLGSIIATNTSQDGFLTGWAAGGPKPATSFLNFLGSRTTSTAFRLPVSAAGLAVFANRKTDLVVDITGFESPGMHGELVTAGSGSAAHLVTGTIDVTGDDIGRATISTGQTAAFLASCTIAASVIDRDVSVDTQIFADGTVHLVTFNDTEFKPAAVFLDARC